MGALPGRVLAMVAVAALASCEDDAKQKTTNVQVAPASDAGSTGTKTDPTAKTEKPIERTTAVPPYGVAMPPPSDDEGLAVPAYGAPPPAPTE